MIKLSQIDIIYKKKKKKNNNNNNLENKTKHKNT